MFQPQVVAALFALYGLMHSEEFEKEDEDNKKKKNKNLQKSIFSSKNYIICIFINF